MASRGPPAARRSCVARQLSVRTKQKNSVTQKAAGVFLLNEVDSYRYLLPWNLVPLEHEPHVTDAVLGPWKLVALCDFPYEVPIRRENPGLHDGHSMEDHLVPGIGRVHWGLCSVSDPKQWGYCTPNERAVCCKGLRRACWRRGMQD
ncbi:hypothetical protein R3P38DRAFT_3570790 [Favolaschia claudopus]|uniref:Uncharacterized protein n=1 Tax=Favolaschia claudopus TaxID=2862362 RepID=A0AAW0AQH1_9AGAR